MSAEGTSEPVNLATLPQDALVVLPGVDKPVPLSQVMTRDTHLTVLNRRNAELAKAEALVKSLSTEDGIEEFATTLIQNGYGHDAFKTLQDAGGSGDQGTPPKGESERPGNGSADEPPTWMKAAFEMQESKIGTLMQAVSSLTANLALKEEISEIQRENPNADLAKLLNIAAEKQQGHFTLKDAAVYASASEKDARIKELEDQLKRRELEEALPGISTALGLGPKVEDRKPVTNSGEQRKVIEELMLEAIEKGVHLPPKA